MTAIPHDASFRDRRANAIVLPSGDQAGWTTRSPGGVSRRVPLPSARITISEQA